MRKVVLAALSVVTAATSLLVAQPAAATFTVTCGRMAPAGYWTPAVRYSWAAIDVPNPSWVDAISAFYYFSGGITPNPVVIEGRVPASPTQFLAAGTFGMFHDVLDLPIPVGVWDVSGDGELYPNFQGDLCAALVTM